MSLSSKLTRLSSKPRTVKKSLTTAEDFSAVAPILIRSKQALATLAILTLTGCTTPPEPAIEVRTVNVAVPVPCREPMPDKPEFPMDGLRPGVSLDGFVAAALAERLVRDGYELRLETALRACTAP